MSRDIIDKIPWHKQDLKSIESQADITFGYLIFYHNTHIPCFEEADLSEIEQRVVIKRLVIQKPSIISGTSR